MFADQPTVPQTREDRLYIYQRLLAYARAHPDRQLCSSLGTASARTPSTGCGSTPRCCSVACGSLPISRSTTRRSPIVLLIST